MTDDYDAVVYDLDGTLVHLAVDWAAVRRDAAAVYRDAGADPDGRDLWGLLEAAEAHGVGSEVEAAIAAHEREGARTSRRLRHADELVDDDRPAAVCSLNCEDACHVALDAHDLATHVAAVVGRDTVPARKPDPRPLLAAVEALDATPARTLFVGDSERDELTAERAGTGFAWVD